jgi:hypothetical protein
MWVSGTDHGGIFMSFIGGLCELSGQPFKRSPKRMLCI